MPLWISSITPPPRLLIISELDLHSIAKFSRLVGVTASYDFNKVSVITVNLNTLFLDIQILNQCLLVVIDQNRGMVKYLIGDSQLFLVLDMLSLLKLL